MRPLLFVTAGVALLVIGAVFAGPVSSGALLLLLPAHQRPAAHDLPADYTPLHKGHITLDTGAYIRENEDLVVPGTPALILRRTYVSSFRNTGAFGFATTHAAERYVIGDPEAFQWAALVRPGESRVRFARTSPGTSFMNAMFQARSHLGDWEGARLGWTGSDWALRQRDGSLARFQSCGPGPNSLCSMVQERDADGHVINYRRDSAGRLMKMEASSNRWIAFEYDDHGRVVRAHDSTPREVHYRYDTRGRLERVTSSDNTVRRYTYTDQGELATILEPETDIENTYKDGRCIRQVNRYADGAEPFVFDFDYQVNGDAVVRTDTRRSDGSWTQYSFDASGFTTSETWGVAGAGPVSFILERDPVTHGVRALSLTCPDRTGRALRRSSLVAPGQEDRIKADLVTTYCSWSQWRTRRVE